MSLKENQFHYAEKKVIYIYSFFIVLSTVYITFGDHTLFYWHFSRRFIQRGGRMHKYLSWTYISNLLLYNFSKFFCYIFGDIFTMSMFDTKTFKIGKRIKWGQISLCCLIDLRVICGLFFNFTNNRRTAKNLRSKNWY